MILPGRLCTIRRWRLADAVSLVAHANDIDVARQLRDRFPHPYTPRDASAFLQYATNEGTDNLAIEVDGEAVGAIGYVRGMDIERFSAEIGYWLGRCYWGRGIATDALITVTEHAFREAGLLRLFALPFAENAGSIRVLEKAGYTCEGRLRASSVKQGVVRDQLLFARINEEWRP
jgi:[ribosomal protein S5]-alanine N-acetyltransferase